MFNKIENYLHKEIWEIHLEDLPKRKAFKVKVLRLISLTVHGFSKSQIQNGASSLVYYTLLALVPVMALFLAISHFFISGVDVKKRVLEQFPSQSFIIEKIFSFAEVSLQRANQGLLAGLGILLLVWSSVKILMRIESVMNQIWEVKKGRSIARKFTDYLTLIVVSPLIFLLSSGLTVYLHTKFESFDHIPLFLRFLTVNILPPLFTGFLLCFLYIFVPNAHVRFKPALIAGLFTGFIYQVVQWAFVYFQIGASNANAIYGTFAALPLFLIWLHLSWVIILLGAKLSFSIQHIDSYDLTEWKKKISHRNQMVLAIEITSFCVKKFIQNKKPPTIKDISYELKIPYSLSQYTLFKLEEAGLLTGIQKNIDDPRYYIPALNPSDLTIKEVIDRIEAQGSDFFHGANSQAILKQLLKLDLHATQSKDNLPVQDLL